MITITLCVEQRLDLAIGTELAYDNIRYIVMPTTDFDYKKNGVCGSCQAPGKLCQHIQCNQYQRKDDTNIILRQIDMEGGEQ